ncbi:MAG: hypothetical protein UX85_C0007G0059 [Candidatus Beckwithbacteria bacterium GW2011_GWB1_47_15]|uniref:Transposase IS200-like domain-containing protein n=1 Tax=Candidatus Beckwithbacteria bacterium GW2011_GWB1_47_15 TaxID=1618371 RepID=A0A0G1RUF4_9BACT|nr:MAG: hypothetical protein UY43_C0001G0522 [Candidatus Beckwithbacteria bacterium GW2011_GWC1_49_16]KKU35128.1 MAG: hypothetical protein UX50_C0006G0054 [Candidatus Beckwithbacteria bacterium GW2011_GWA1_46_30]KKU60772.1 MAG: hypothetical protein UX85_C0007G0059 [Candidatus Beckwithbacteria bacterium GW2011_GWB1_47_15]KKU71577.1 MAG: hypothetical protein UX97_C0005G0060 [Candidatus Beckwithbacteria bacterium GW2011_GWA2_47_25]KKW03470.1 MAG: hypothetical protein UY37_C0005G0033 [Candidatus Be
MPGKNVIKEYKEKAYYHIYNRGVAKQEIFLDDQDYRVFLSYLKSYLSPVEALDEKKIVISPSRRLKNYSDSVDLLCYCLMPNHFHLVIYQKDASSINFFMRSLATRYSMFFNRKYKRVGPLFQGTYKAVEVVSEDQFIYLTKYVHRNPLKILPSGINLEGYKYSSYPNYLRIYNQIWVQPGVILDYFSKSNPEKSYSEFVEEIESQGERFIKSLVLEET